jgi:hypothetical protein
MAGNESPEMSAFVSRRNVLSRSERRHLGSCSALVLFLIVTLLFYFALSLAPLSPGQRVAKVLAQVGMEEGCVGRQLQVKA